MSGTSTGIQKSVEQLGFKFSDIKILLGNHAHGDHQEGDALVKQMTGAQVMAMAEDVPALQAMKPGGEASDRQDPARRRYGHARRDDAGRASDAPATRAARQPGRRRRRRAGEPTTWCSSAACALRLQARDNPEAPASPTSSRARSRSHEACHATSPWHHIPRCITWPRRTRESAGGTEPVHRPCRLRARARPHRSDVPGNNLRRSRSWPGSSPQTPSPSPKPQAPSLKASSVA